MATTQSAPVPAHELYIEPTQLPKLRSNRGKYVDSASIGYMRPTPADASMEELRRRFEEDGYIWVKQLLPREDVLDMREHYFEHMSPTGILKPGTSPRDGVFDDSQDPIAHSGVGGTDLPDDVEKVKKLTSAHTSPIYQAFLAHPQFRGFIREFMGWKKETMVMRNMLRHNVPNGLSTGIHYDRIFLRAGEAEFLTAWVPIGDCSAAGGGLTYLADSSELGKKMEADFTIRNMELSPEERIRGFNVNMNKDGQLSHDVEELGRTLCPQGHKWLVPSGEGYEAGDVVFHNPYMIHGACKNEDPLGRIRLSSDVRFYEEGAPMDKRWMVFWSPNDGL